MWLFSCCRIICWKDCCFPIGWFWYPCWKSVDSRCMGLFLCSHIDLYVLSLFQTYIWFDFETFYCVFFSCLSFFFFNLFMAVLGLRFCVRAFYSCGKGGHSSTRCAGLSLLRPLLLRSTGSRRAGSVIVAHGPSCFVACGIFPDQGSNPCPLHWQADSQPLCHQGSPVLPFF